MKMSGWLGTSKHLFTCAIKYGSNIVFGPFHYWFDNDHEPKFYMETTPIEENIYIETGDFKVYVSVILRKLLKEVPIPSSFKNELRYTNDEVIQSLIENKYYELVKDKWNLMFTIDFKNVNDISLLHTDFCCYTLGYLVRTDNNIYFCKMDTHPYFFEKLSNIQDDINLVLCLIPEGKMIIDMSLLLSESYHFIFIKKTSRKEILNKKFINGLYYIDGEPFTGKDDTGNEYRYYTDGKLGVKDRPSIITKRGEIKGWHINGEVDDVNFYKSISILTMFNEVLKTNDREKIDILYREYPYLMEITILKEKNKM